MMRCFKVTLFSFAFIALSTSQETSPSFKWPLQRRNAGISAVQPSVYQWDTNVTIGGQTVTLGIDTGSSFL